MAIPLIIDRLKIISDELHLLSILMDRARGWTNGEAVYTLLQKRFNELLKERKALATDLSTHIGV